MAISSLVQFNLYTSSMFMICQKLAHTITKNKTRLTQSNEKKSAMDPQEFYTCRYKHTVYPTEPIQRYVFGLKQKITAFTLWTARERVETTKNQK